MGMSSRFAVALWLGLCSCSFVEAPTYPRPALALPASARAPFELPGPVVLIRLEPLAGNDVVVGDLACGEETVHFQLHRAARKDAPLVLLVPILAGGQELQRMMAARFVARGYHVVFCDRVGPAMRPPQRGPDLERMLARTVIHQRAVLAWLADCREVHPPAIFACGASLGGIVTTLLTAVEPDLAGAAMCLAGADLPSILVDSNEARILKWRDWRRDTDGLAGTPLDQELRAALQSDPLHYAPYVDTDRVFLIATSFDDVVRPAHQDLLWEALGRPQRLSVPLGHYTAALALDPLMSSIADFFDARCELARSLADPSRVAPALGDPSGRVAAEAAPTGH